MKVFILTTIAGAGHNTAARAVERAFRLCHPDQAIEYLDASQFGTALVRKMYNDAYLKLVEATPALWGYFYDHYDHHRMGRSKERLKALFARINSRPLMKKLQDERPDVVLATHFYPAEIALRLKRKGRLSAPIHLVITDFQPHSFWVLEGIERYYVADEETRHALAARGVEPARISVTGIPVDPKFGAARDRGEIASKLGIDPRLFTVLVSSGGMGVGPLEEVVKGLLEFGRVPQILVVCGRNEKLKETLDAVTPPPGVVMKVFGFVTNMEEMMSAADLLVSKCGGLTTAEALAVGLPLVVLHPIPGQEAQNADLLLERGVAVKANDVAALRYKIGRILDDPGALETMRTRCRSMGRAAAAMDIARQVLEHPGQPSATGDASPSGS